MEGPDHQASVTFDELGIICKYAKNIDSMLGDGIKTTNEVEKKNRELIRKSLYINVERVAKGDVLSEWDIACKRPYNEKLVEPKDMAKIVGRDLKI